MLCFHHELLYEAKVLEHKHADPSDKKTAILYRVHYKGWKNTWDDWVPQDRLRKFTEENKELAQDLRQDLKREMEAQRQRAAPKSAVGRKKTAGSDFSSIRGSEERHSSVPVTGRGTKRGRDMDLDKEEAFHSRPAVRLPIPDHLKALLVDDWENVTKNLSLVPLPSAHPVSEILTAYLEEEKLKRRPGSAEWDLVEEVVAGLKEYFDQTLGRILLYRFEREQYFQVRKKMEKGDVKFVDKTASDIYGAEHLCRLFVTLPELIAQTNMDTQSVNRLREELTKITSWLGKNSQRFFTAEYEVASAEYTEKARGAE